MFSSASNLVNGLTILIDDTAETLVDITDFQLSNGVWTGTFVITIRDWFGVDKGDVTKYQFWPFGDGFAAWWTLQHQRNYPPLHTIVSVGITLSGHL